MAGGGAVEAPGWAGFLEHLEAVTGKRVQFFAVDSISVPVALLVAIFLMVLVSEWVAARVRAAIR